jgi:hypothetical protein
MVDPDFTDKRNWCDTKGERIKEKKRLLVLVSPKGFGTSNGVRPKS